MFVPEPDDLDEMTQLILGPGAVFEQLGPESRIQVIQLVNQSDTAEMLSKIHDVLNDIEVDFRAVGEWFRVSRET